MTHTLDALRDKARLYTYADEDKCIRENDGLSIFHVMIDRY